MTDAKREKQRNREKEAVASAVRKFQEKLKLSPEDSATGWAMLHGHWKRLADAIRDEQTSLKKKRRLADDGHLFLFLEADSLAVITLQSIIWDRGSDFANGEENAEEQEEKMAEDADESESEDALIERAREVQTGRKKHTALAREIGRRCHHECNVMPSARIKKGVARCLERYKSTRTKAKDTRTINEVVFGDWSTKGRDISLGCRLLKVAAKSDIVIIEFSNVTGGSVAYSVALSATFGEAFKQCADAQQDLLTPNYRPMIVPPEPWTRRLDDGGYLNNKMSTLKWRTHLVIHRNDRPRIEVLKKGSFPNVLAAVNALQETKWKINRRIYDMMLAVTVMRRDKKLHDLSKEQRMRLSPLVKQGWRTVSVLEAKCQICSDIKDEEVIYFPYRLDYRGRAYPLPDAVHPQADDIGRSLLLFGGLGKRLGDSGERWLAIHLANAWGTETTDNTTRTLDKQAYRERVAWTRRNSEKIVKSARDPVHDYWWMTASEPWRFLAACFEWEAFLSDKEDFLSHLPVTIDGTCNGLQHLSALRLDPTVAAETNLMPGDQPSDIYETITAEVISDLDEASESGDVRADKWHWRNLRLPADEGDNDGRPRYMVVDRSGCKLAVMTTPYGVTREGMQRQLFVKELSAPLTKRALRPIEQGEIKQPRSFIAKLRDGDCPLARFLWDSIAPEEQKALSQSGEDLDVLRDRIASALNATINGPLIYETQRFANIDLSPEARRLISKPGELFASTTELTEADRRSVNFEDSKAALENRKINRVNRLLLEDAYPREIKRSQRDRWLGCGYLANIISDCINRIVDPGNKLAKWFQGIAEELANSGHGVCWTAPSGFPVLQESWEPVTKRISAGEMEVVTYVPSDVRDPKAERRKIVANFIHSLDAAHMVLTVRRLHSEGLEHFGVIHDCFAVHACDVDQLSKTLRREFVGMYKIPDGGHSLLDTFHREQSKIAGKEFRPPPPPGDFVIEKVLESEYFFC